MCGIQFCWRVQLCESLRTISREVSVYTQRMPVSTLAMSLSGHRRKSDRGVMRFSCFHALIIVDVLLLVRCVDASPTLLDRFASAFQRQEMPSPESVEPVLPVSLPLPPSVGDADQPDPCYDKETGVIAQRCAPGFVNAAFGRRVSASSTCGETSPSRYCLPSGTTWQSSTSSSSSSCHVCDSSDVKLSHPASHLTDLNNPNDVTCWISEPASASNNVSLTPVSYTHLTLPTKRIV